tara:strand:+ start:487 stop:1389 length:903 start_codon:yes stop_codon:yes gene_type:complete
MLNDSEKVNDAIILAGGRGTRMLPASKYTPKELLPLVDIPILNHLIWEACKAGVEKIHIVLSPQKIKIIGKILNEYDDLESDLIARPDIPKEVLDIRISDVEIIVYEQQKSRGIGDALSIVLNSIKGPFIVLLGDNILLDNHPNLNQMGISNASNCSKMLINHFNKFGLPCAGIIKVDNKDLNKYGIVGINEGLINQIIEKPNISNSPSNYALCGRYLLPSNTGNILSLFPVEEHGEMQSIEVFKYIINETGLGAVKLDDFQLYDSGDPITWLKSQIDHSLRREDIGEELLTWISSKIKE